MINTKWFQILANTRVTPILTRNIRHLLGPVDECLVAELSMKVSTTLAFRDHGF